MPFAFCGLKQWVRRMCEPAQPKLTYHFNTTAGYWEVSTEIMTWLMWTIYQYSPFRWQKVLTLHSVLVERRRGVSSSGGHWHFFHFCQWEPRGQAGVTGWASQEGWMAHAWLAFLAVHTKVPPHSLLPQTAHQPKQPILSRVLGRVMSSSTRWHSRDVWVLCLTAKPRNGYSANVYMLWSSRGWHCFQSCRLQSSFSPSSHLL